MAIKFNQVAKHGKLQFLPDVALAFEDTNAEAYFIAAGWAATTSDMPVLTYPEGSVDIDPETVHASGPNAGQRVLEG